MVGEYSRVASATVELPRDLASVEVRGRFNRRYGEMVTPEKIKDK
jgi:hypothetical protein